MTVDELKRSLAELLSQEECGVVDWERIQDLSIELLTRLREQDGLDYPPEIVITYLTSFEMRRIDGAEAGRQHATLTAYLRDQIGRFTDTRAARCPRSRAGRGLPA